MWYMCIILIVVVLQKYLSQSLECNKLTNKRFYGNEGNRIRVGCNHSESIKFCYITHSAETERSCTVHEDRKNDCPSDSGITFVGNIEKRTCEFEVEVKTLEDTSWRLQISKESYWNFNVFGVDDCFKVNEDFISTDYNNSKAESVIECQKQCQNTPVCQNWAWITENGKNWNERDNPKVCYFKGNKASSTTINNVISGPKNCPVPERTEFKILSCSELTSYQILSGNSISFSCKTNQAISQCTLKKTGDSNMIYQSSTSTESRAKFSYSSDKTNCTVELTNLVEADSGGWIFELRGESAQNVQSREIQLKVQNCSEYNIVYNGTDNDNEINSNSASDCQFACLQKTTCSMWTFNPQGKCKLSGVENYKGKISKNGFISGPSKCRGCYRLGIGINGTKEMLGSIQTNVANPFECQKLCNENQKCKLFNFNTMSKNCFLRSGVEKDKLVTVPAAIVGAKDCAKPNDIWVTVDSPQPLPPTSTTTTSTNTTTTISTKATITTITESTTSTTQQKNEVTAIQETHTESPSENTSTLSTNKDNGIRIGGIIGGLVFVLLVGLIVVFVLHKKKKRRELLRPVSVVPTRTSRVSMAQLETRDDKRRPITVAELTMGVPLKKYPVKNEYNMLVDADSKHNGFRFTNNDGRKYTAAQNGGFNRYGNILPYDHNRVILNSKVNDCDYVNASWIANNSLPLNMPRFIAAQGPFDRTIPHFLQMVVDYDVKAIVMLTKLTESTKGAAGTTIETEKSSKYWPNSDIQDGQTFGHFKVTTQSEHLLHQIENTMVRKLQIEDTLTKKIHGPVTHFHFTAWPDFGVAEHCGTIIDLVQTVRNVVGKYEGSSTVIVHCSAGVGRTGTLIALYKLMEKIDAKVVNETIDIYNEVFQLREDRCCMVQKEEQYKFLYECVASYFSHDSSANDPDYIYTFYNFEDDNIA